MRTALTLKNINVICTRKQFLIGSVGAAVGLFCGRGLLQAQPGSRLSGAAPSATPESADKVPDFPEHHPHSIEHASSVSLLPVTRIWRR